AGLAPASQEVLSSGAGAHRLRRLSPRPQGRSLPGARRLRARRLAGDHQAPGQPPRELDLDRRARAPAGRIARHPSRAAQERVKRLWRWPIPLPPLPPPVLLAPRFVFRPRATPPPPPPRP